MGRGAEGWTTPGVDQLSDFIFLPRHPPGKAQAQRLF